MRADVAFTILLLLRKEVIKFNAILAFMTYFFFKDTLMRFHAIGFARRKRGKMEIGNDYTYFNDNMNNKRHGQFE